MVIASRLLTALEESGKTDKFVNLVITKGLIRFERRGDTFNQMCKSIFVLFLALWHPDIDIFFSDNDGFSQIVELIGL